MCKLQTIGESRFPNRNLPIAKLSTAKRYLVPLHKLSSKLKKTYISIAPCVVACY